VDITKYITTLIYENECVVVPGFGAFVSVYKPAQFDENQETIFPPSKEITFDGKLKNNDWLLANFISAGESIPRFEALKKIEEFCENVQYRLEKGETFEFEGLGTISHDEKGNPVFAVSTDKNFLLDSFGLTSVSLKTHTHQHHQEPEGEAVEEKSNYKKRAWWLFFLLPITGVALFVYLFFFIPKKHNTILPESNVFVPDTSASIEIPISADTIQTQSANDTLQKTPMVSEKTEVFTPQTGNYYLIGGSFKEQENVDKYMKKIEKAGYKPINLGKKGNFFIVAVGVYESFIEADSAMTEYKKNDPESGVWIKKIQEK
jgi:nucleoid DNA-binding protein